MKTILISIFLFLTFSSHSQTYDVMIIPNQKSLIATYNSNYSRFGFYVGGYFMTSFPAPYIYTTPASYINRLGINYSNGKTSLMVGGFVENFRDSIRIQPDIWIKVYPLRIITNTTQGFDVIIAANYMKGLNLGVGVALQFGGIYCR